MIMMSGALSGLAGSWSRVLSDILPFGPDSRLHWTGLSAFLLIGSAVYLFQRKRLRDNGYRSLGNFLMPLELYRTRSSLVDIKIYLANKLFAPAKSLLFVAVFSSTALAIANLTGSPPASGGEARPGLLLIALATVLSALATDLAYYFTHRASHEIAWLWPFHKVHHSAEVLTPITAKRNHPVFDLLLKAITASLAGLAAGGILGLTGVFEVRTVLGVGLFIAVLNFTGGALRHSHIWLDYGPLLDRILISPAQHQIHHSRAPRHHDRNYGLIFAFWDWMFGTLYVPDGREELEFGIADREGRAEPQVHNTLAEAYLVPFREVAVALEKRKRETSS